MRGARCAEGVLEVLRCTHALDKYRTTLVSTSCARLARLHNDVARRCES